MSPLDDDHNVNPRRTVDDRTAEALLSGHDVPSEAALGTFFAELRDLGVAPAPAPNLALSAMLESGLAADALVQPTAAPVTRWTRLRGVVSWRTSSDEAVSWRTAHRRSWVVPLQLSLAGSGCLALVLVAASTNQLPDAAQSAVANVVEAITPLDLPRPGDDHPKPAVSPTPSAEADDTSEAGAPDEGTGPGRGGSGSELGEDNRDDHSSDGRGNDDSGRDGAGREDHTAEPSESDDRSDQGPGSGSSEGSGGDRSGSDDAEADESGSDPSSTDDAGTGSGTDNSGSGDSVDP